MATDDTIAQVIREARDAERDAYWERQRQLAAALLAYPMAAQSIETRATFRMTEDVRMPDDPSLRVLELRVSSERWLGSEPGVPHEDFVPGEKPHIEAHAYVQPMTKQGKPKERTCAHWTHVPNDLVAPLLGRVQIS